MRTEKQIYLLENRRGQEFAEKIEALDKILVPDMKSQQEELRQYADKYRNYMPIIQNGVFIQRYKTAEDYLLFQLLDVEEPLESPDRPKLTFHIDSLQKAIPDYYRNHSNTKEFLAQAKEESKDKWLILKDRIENGTMWWMYSCNVEVSFDGKRLALKYMDFTTAKREILEKQNLAYNVSQERGTELTQDMNSFLLVMMWLNYINENPEMKVIQSTEKQKTVQKQKKNELAAREEEQEDKENRKKRPVPKSIVLNGVRIASSSEKLMRKISSKKRQRFVESWNVRGHYRHYKKSGKTVYIKPYRKGKADGKTETKTYEIRVK